MVRGNPGAGVGTYPGVIVADECACETARESQPLDQGEVAPIVKEINFSDKDMFCGIFCRPCSFTLHLL